ncbi:MAG TPA: hypothetical protein VK671_16680, partial [Mucilaginibacter sp.]|nr:hypothetical protein [Mucilaginibacter sp.]
AEEANDVGQSHGFDANYINPVFFVSSFGPSKPAPDHTLFGFNGKYKILNKTTVYGQFLYDQASSTDSTKGSRYAWQIGFRGSDLFKISRLNYLFEYNTSKPYTYSSQYPIVNYSQLSEPLADPLGSDYKELVGILNYSIGKFDLQGQINYAKYATGTAQLTGAAGTNLAPGIISSGQSFTNTLKYAEGTIAYVLNPKYNLRIEVGGLLRQSTSSVSDTKTAMFIFGLRSTFRDLYHDF